PADRVVPRPAELDAVPAAAWWVAASTAYGALVETAGMRPGDRILVTAATGGVGRAALQVAAQVGAVPIAVTPHAARRDALLAAPSARPPAPVLSCPPTRPTSWPPAGSTPRAWEPTSSSTWCAGRARRTSPRRPDPAGRCSPPGSSTPGLRRPWTGR